MAEKLKLGILSSLHQVLAVGRHSESLQEVVIYQALYGGNGGYGVWVRPLAMFLETIEYEGKVQPRFAFVHPNFTKACEVE